MILPLPTTSVVVSSRAVAVEEDALVMMMREFVHR
jgi:hypothetical protein